MRRKDLIKRLATTLVRRRDALRKTLAAHAQMIAVDNRGVGDSIDAALDCEQDELDSQLVAVESVELAAIDAALDRIREGCYGTCEGCEKSIPAARLQAVPYAIFCIKCQREEERGGCGRAGDRHWERVSGEFSDDEPNHKNGLEFESV